MHLDRWRAGLTASLALAWATALMAVRSAPAAAVPPEVTGVLVAGLALAAALASLVASEPG